METDMTKLQTRRAIRDRVIELQDQGIKTSGNEDMSLAAIGRTLDPPVSRAAVSQLAKGLTANPRIREAIERELGQPFWMKQNKRAA